MEEAHDYLSLLPPLLFSFQCCVLLLLHIQIGAFFHLRPLPLPLPPSRPIQLTLEEEEEGREINPCLGDGESFTGNKEEKGYLHTFEQKEGFSILFGDILWNQTLLCAGKETGKKECFRSTNSYILHTHRTNLCTVDRTNPLLPSRKLLWAEEGLGGEVKWAGLISRFSEVLYYSA